MKFVFGALLGGYSTGELQRLQVIVEAIDPDSLTGKTVAHELHRRGPTLVGGCPECVRAARETLRAVEAATLTTEASPP